MFIDEITITVRSGSGGKGCESYHMRPDRKYIPNGGDGGDGGDIIVQADANTGSLFALKSKRIFEAERGSHGLGSNQYGRKGKDCIITVPCGTTIHNKKDNLLIRDLVHSGEEVTVLKGGKRGYGNHARRPATSGEEGKELELFLSFKIIADIFLIGLPNSGKTALLKHLTGAGVTETEYPFGTKSPQAGTYQSNEVEIKFCDLPSIYQASGEGHGLGTHFLKHLERAKLLFWVLDPKNEFAAGLTEGYQIITKTIREFNPEYIKIPKLIVVNKSDLLPAKDQKKKYLPNTEKVYFISVKEKTGIDRLMKDAGRLLKSGNL